MLTFAQAVEKVDATGLPVVEGFTTELEAGADAAAVGAGITSRLRTRFPKHAWKVEKEKMPDGWLLFRATVADTPSLGEAWEAVRELEGLAGVAGAEPLLVTRLAVTNGSEAE